MRVIAGKYRSRRLQSLRGPSIRPTADRMRETLFNVLCAGDPCALKGTVWIDLLAGSGAVGHGRAGARRRAAGRCGDEVPAPAELRAPEEIGQVLSARDRSRRLLDLTLGRRRRLSRCDAPRAKPKSEGDQGASRHQADLDQGE